MTVWQQRALSVRLERMIEEWEMRYLKKLDPPKTRKTKPKR